MPTTHYHRGTAIATKKVVRLEAGSSFVGSFKLGLGPKLIGPFSGFNPQNIVEAWNSMQDALFRDITAEVVSGGVNFTHKTAGQDFEITLEIAGETSGTLTVSAKQYLRFLGGVTGGTFTLTFDGQTTNPITYDPDDPEGTASAIREALEALSNIQIGDVAVTHTSPIEFIVDFSPGQYSGMDVPTFEADYSGLTGSPVEVVVSTIQDGFEGVDEVQRLSFVGEPTVTVLRPVELYKEKQQVEIIGSVSGGTFTLTVPGYGTTEPIPYNADRLVLKRKLEPVVGVGNVSVTGSPLPDGKLVVEFKGSLKGLNIPEMTADGSGLNSIGDLDITVSVVQEFIYGQNSVRRHALQPYFPTSAVGNYYMVFRVGGSNGVRTWCDADATAEEIYNTLIGGWHLAQNPMIPFNPAHPYGDTGPITIFKPEDVEVTGSLASGDNSFTITIKNRLNTIPYDIILASKTSSDWHNLITTIISEPSDGIAEVQKAVINTPLPLTYGSNFYLKLGDTVIGPIAFDQDLNVVAERMQKQLAKAFGQEVPRPVNGLRVRTVSRDSIGDSDYITDKIVPYPITVEALQEVYNNEPISNIFRNYIWTVDIYWLTGRGRWKESSGWEGSNGLQTHLKEFKNSYGSTPTTYEQFRQLLQSMLDSFFNSDSELKYLRKYRVEQPICKVSYYSSGSYFYFVFGNWPFLNGINPPLIEFLTAPPGDPVGVRVSTLQDGHQEGGDYEEVPSITGGTFDLGFQRESGGALTWVKGLSYDISSSSLQNIVNSMLGSNAVSVTGGPLLEEPMVFTFGGAYAKTNMKPTKIRSRFWGDILGTQKIEVIRTAHLQTTASHVYDFEIVPGKGTLGLKLSQSWSGADGDTTWGKFKIITSDGRLFSTYFRWAHCSALDIENALNEMFGERVCLVYQVVHSQELGEIGPISYFSSGLHRAWYNRDVFRIVFFGPYADPSSISEFSFEFEKINLIPADFLDETRGTDHDDLAEESFRVYMLFKTAHDRGEPLHKFNIRRSNINSTLLGWRYHLVTRYGDNSYISDISVAGETSNVNRKDISKAVIAEIVPDMKIRFVWMLTQVRHVDIGLGVAQPVSPTSAGQSSSEFLQTEWIDWDAPAEQIQKAIINAMPFLDGNITVTGGLYGSWLPYGHDNEDTEERYQDLRITLNNKLHHLPLDELGYVLYMEISGPDYITKYPVGDTQYNLPYVFQHVVSRPIPPLRNERVRITMHQGTPDEAFVGIGDGERFVPFPINATINQIQAAIDNVFPRINAPAYALPAKYTKSVLVYGSSVRDGLELEFTGAGYQYTSRSEIGFIFNSDGLLELETLVEGQPDRPEIQSIALPSDSYSGTFTLTYSGQTTSTLGYNATATQVKAALEALSNIDVGDITVTGGPLPESGLSVIFNAALGDVPQITATSSGIKRHRMQIQNIHGGINGSGYIKLLEVVRGAGPRYFLTPENYNTNQPIGCGDTIVIDQSNIPIEFDLDLVTPIKVVRFGATIPALFMFQRPRRVFINGQRVYLRNVGGLLPGGLTEGYYYIVGAESDFTFQLSETLGGTPINVVDVGEGTHILELRHLTIIQYARFAGGRIGLPNRRSNGEFEYLPRYLRGGFDLIDLGVEAGDGLSLGRFHCINQGADTQVIVRTSGSSSNTIPPITLIFNDLEHHSLVQHGGEVGIAVYPEESSELRSIQQYEGLLVVGRVTVRDDVEIHNGEIRSLAGSVGGTLIIR